MQVIPAVDIMDAHAVRLVRGDGSRKSEYGDPIEAALMWAKQGAKMIHVIDLDAALGKGSNMDVVRGVIEKVGVGVQVGGGVRSVIAASELLDCGASRVILGSLAFREPEAVKRLVHLYGDDRIVVSLDHSDGVLKVSGWRTDAGALICEAFERFVGLGVSRFLVTCIDRDGTLGSPDAATVKVLAGRVRIMAAGGVGSLDDIKLLKSAGVEAAVVGKALYEGRFTLPQALEAVQG